MKPMQRFFITAFIMINAMIIVNAGFMMPLWSDFVKHIGGDIRTAGKAVLVFSIVIGFVTCIAGQIESKLKKDYFFMVLSQAVMCIGYIGYFFVHNPSELYIVQIILGLGGAFQSPVLCALYQRSIPSDKTSHYWGIWNGVYQIAIGIGALAGAYIVHHFNYSVMFDAMLGISLLCLGIVVLTMRQTVQQGTSSEAVSV